MMVATPHKVPLFGSKLIKITTKTDDLISHLLHRQVANGQEQLQNKNA